MNIFKKMFGEGGGDLPPSKADKQVAYWLKELDKACEREKRYRTTAKKVEKIYEPEEGCDEEVPFNILFSNTETLLPALYNNTPRPEVSRRYQRPDPVAQLGARVLEAFLKFQLDTNGRDYTTFDDLISYAVLQALVPGRGITWFKYKPTFEERKETIVGEDGKLEEDSYEALVAEQVCWEEVPWDCFLCGYARTWENVPWVARTHFMSRTELEENFGPAAAREVPCNTAEDSGNKGDSDGRSEDSKNVTLATVYEVWDKRSRKVYFLAKGYKNLLKEPADDPLKLSGFFPCPKPLQFLARNKSMIPIPIYQMYKNQAEELNRVTRRLNSLISQLKVRGMYDGTVHGIEQVLQGEDGTLVPAENVAAMQQGQTLEKSIWLMPLGEISSVIQQLYQERQQVKTVIYEITGIADIMRGSSAASETLGAQELKSQWGTLRLKRMQRAVSQYVRECLRIAVEVASQQFNAETFAAITGYDLPTAEMKQQAQMQLQQAQMMGQQIPPEAQAQVQKLMETPSWDEIIAFFRDDPMRQYRIDIETNSTVDIEATEDKAQVGEFLNAMAQFLNGITPIVQAGALPPDAAKSILTAVVRRFRFGVEVEDSLNQMTAPQPQGGQEDQAAKEAAEIERQSLMQTEQAKQQALQMEMEFKQAEHALKMEELQLKREMMHEKAKIDQQKLLLQAELAAASPVPSGE